MNNSPHHYGPIKELQNVKLADIFWSKYKVNTSQLIYASFATYISKEPAIKFSYTNDMARRNLKFFLISLLECRRRRNDTRWDNKECHVQLGQVLCRSWNKSTGWEAETRGWPDGSVARTESFPIVSDRVRWMTGALSCHTISLVLSGPLHLPSSPGKEFPNSANLSPEPCPFF